MTPAFGLDIGQVSLKAVWLEARKADLSLKSFLRTRALDKSMTSVSPFDEEQIAKDINDHLNEAKISLRSVHLAIPDNQTYMKVIEMPELNDKELASAIVWEAEQYIPAPLSTIMLDWQVLQRGLRSNTGNKMQVLMVGSPITFLKKYQKILERSGLTILSIEPSILSTIRSVVTPGFPVSVVLNISNVCTTIAIVQNNLIVFVYTIPIGGASINRAIATDFGFSADQAEEYKRAYGITDQNIGGKIGRAIEPILSSLLTEIKKALTFYNEKYKSVAPITQVVLSGGSAKLPGLDVYFVKNLGFETVVANPWKTLKIQNVPQQILEDGPEFSVAIGLGMKAYEQ